MKEEEAIIKKAPMQMKEMLNSVYSFNRNKGSGKMMRKILLSMIDVDRRFFTYADNPYDDNALPIRREQTISQPSTVARMLLLADLKEGDEVLEVGAGSGWNAALISFLVYPGDVISVDRIGELVEGAKSNLVSLKNHFKRTKKGAIDRLEKLYFLKEDIFSQSELWDKNFDKVIITAGISDKKTEKKIEKAANTLLKEGGILICPYTSGPIIKYIKKNGLQREETKEQYVFVPLLQGVEE
jgi:protein-L-isoaspartate(D-aspartate) O-methyltransferase